MAYYISARFTRKQSTSRHEEGFSKCVRNDKVSFGLMECQHACLMMGGWVGVSHFGGLAAFHFSRSNGRPDEP